MKRLKGWMLGWLILLLTVVPLTGCFSQETPIDPTKKVAEYTKPAVVRVVSYNSITYRLDSELAAFLNINQEVTVYDGGTGSGAILTSDGYIVSNAHVIEAAGLAEQEAEERIHQMFIEQLMVVINEEAPMYREALFNYALETTQFKKMERVQKVVLPGGDEYPFSVKNHGKAIGEGKDVAILKIDANNLPTVSIDETDHVETADKVVIAGYPGKADLDGFLDEQSALVSTYTNGAVAARKNSGQGPLLQLDANVNPGNSGGPVFTLDGKMVGIATATSHDGIGWAVPASTVLEFVKEANITINQPDTVTISWQEGLDLYWQGYYSKALEKFTEVQRLYPKHYEIESYIKQAQTAISEGRDKSDWSNYFPFLFAEPIAERYL